jgi:hypothetical protein
MVDELTHFTEAMYRFLRSRVRVAGIDLLAQHRGGETPSRGIPNRRRARADCSGTTMVPRRREPRQGVFVHLRAEHIEDHLAHALRMSALCSNDPVCAQHMPEHGGRWLHGAACHGCALVSETSCEMRNDYLDRALVVRVLGVSGAAFFQFIPRSMPFSTYDSELTAQLIKRWPQRRWLSRSPASYDGWSRLTFHNRHSRT